MKRLNVRRCAYGQRHELGQRRQRKVGTILQEWERLQDINLVEHARSPDIVLEAFAVGSELGNSFKYSGVERDAEWLAHVLETIE